MSAPTDDDAAPALRRPLRSVKRTAGMHPDAGMNAIGLLIAAGLAVLFLPLAVPLSVVLFLVWLADRLRGRAE